MIARPSLFGDHWSTLLFATLLGLAAAVPAFGRGDRRALAVAGICLLPAALLLDPPLSTALLRSSFYLSARIAALLRFPLYVGVAWGLAALAAARRGEPVRRASAVLAAAALAVALYANAAPLRALFAPASADASTFASSRSADIRTMWGPETVRKMAAEIGTGYPVVAGDFEATYYLAGLLPVRVVAAPPRHAPFAIEVRDGERRRKDIETLLDPHTPEAVRREIIARRDVSYVLVSPTSRALKNALKTLNAEPDLFEPVVAGRSTVLFRVRR